MREDTRRTVVPRMILAMRSISASSGFPDDIQVAQSRLSTPMFQPFGTHGLNMGR